MNEIWKWLGEQLGNILGVLGLVAGVWFYLLSRKPKRFGWQVISRTRIISHQSKALPLQVVYAGQAVNSPNITVLRVGNTGKAEIHSRDFDGPVRIEFENSTLLSATVNRKFDEGIATDFDQDSKSVTYMPPMMNAGEWVEFQLVTDGPLEVPVVHARVAGQNGASPDMERIRVKRWGSVALCGVALSILAPIALIVLLRHEWVWIGVAGMVSGLLMLVVGGNMMGRDTGGWAKTSKGK